VLLGLPLLISAWILFYYFSDPFVPVLNPNGTKVTLSWFLNFLARQIMVLEVSRIIQFIVLDWILLGCKVAEKMGSYATLVSIQSHGFPFLLIVWACLDFAVLRGQNDFMSYWYKWTGKLSFFLVTLLMLCWKSISHLISFWSQDLYFIPKPIRQSFCFQFCTCECCFVRFL
jgi:hypothetical protein